MKKLIIASAIGLACSAPLQAADVVAYFDAERNKLVLPHLEVGGVVYYATLTLVNADNLIFRADVETLTDLTPPAGVENNNDIASIVGTWTVPGVPASELTITFNSDGSYSHEEQNEECANGGGREEGTYHWEPSTGVLQLVNLTLDENGECGLSHPRDGVPLRVFIDGNSAEVFERGEQGGFETFQFQRNG